MIGQGVICQILNGREGQEVDCYLTEQSLSFSGHRERPRQCLLAKVG